MKELLMQFSSDVVQQLSIEQMFMSMIVALLLGMVVYLSYRFSHAKAVYSAKFNVSLVMMTLITAMIMNVIGNNIALSLGMVGALSIVRFRTAIKDSRDTAYIFWCIAIGICCGVAYYALACIGTGIIFLTMLALGNVKANDRYLLIVQANGQASNKQIEHSILVQFSGKATMRVMDNVRGHTEYIYELSSNLLEEAKKRSDPVQELLAIPGIERVNLVCQNEEMSR